MNQIYPIHNGWMPFFNEHKKELESIMETVNKEKSIVYPNNSDIFKAFYYFPPEETKLVILGQDPYIGYEMIDGIKVPQACGLSFSVPACHKKIPPSLKNIFKELKNNYPDFILPKNGCLKKWVENEKILLLNCALTVIEGKSNSMMKLWEQFTDMIITYISNKSPNTVFLLMGNYAINKSKLISKTENNPKIFITVHPSPLSASKGFFGSNVFKNINDYLVTQNIIPINWKL